MSESAFNSYWRVLKQWAPFVVIAALLGGAIGYFAANLRADVYTARTVVAIGSYLEAPNPNFDDIRLALQLVDTYAVIAETTDVMRTIIDKLDLPDSITTLRDAITIDNVPNTSLLEIVVEYPGPERAADIANTVTEELIARSPSNITEALQRQADLSRTQIELLNTQLDDLLNQVNDIDAQIAAAENQSEIDRLAITRSGIIQQINQVTATIAQFSNTVTQIEQRSNSLEIVERAVPPTQPASSGGILFAIIGVILGGVVSSGVILFYDTTTSPIRSRSQIDNSLGLPIRGELVRANRNENGKLVNHLVSGSAVVEGYRRLRTNLIYSASENNKRLWVVTSANPDEGKSTVISNLALSLAASDLKVLLIDADLRAPRVHSILGIENKEGLTNLLSNMPPTDMDAAIKQLERVARPVKDTRLQVITSGAKTQYPTELLESQAMRAWLPILESQFDYILFDTPPVLAVSDTPVLATNSDSRVLLLVEYGHTRLSAAYHALEELDQVGAQLDGIIVHKVDRSAVTAKGYVN